MTNDNIEQQLRQLGRDWPASKSFVERVTSQIDSQPPRPVVSRSTGISITRTSYVTVGAIIACFGLWWAFGSQSTGSVLYAQVKDALRQVQTIHEVATLHSDDGEKHQFGETWFVRGRGFSLIRDDQIRVDNGTYFWEHKKGADTASRTKSLGTDESLDQTLNIREELDRSCERYPDGDRSINGVPHECYQFTYHGPMKPVDRSALDLDKRRSLIFISPESLPVRAEMAEKIDGEWKIRFVRTWDYDVPVDAEIFEPQFADGVRIIDVDEAFEQLTNVKNAFYTEVREGLIYTIHRATRFENGGVMILSTVRGTDETLRKYPLTRRRLQPGLFITDGPAKNWQASPQGSGNFRLKLAEANHLGVDAQWWMMVPRGRLPNWFEDKDGKVRLEIGITPTGGEYAKANHADENGVIHHINWVLTLDIPKPKQLPSLNDITAQVHSELSMLKAMSFPGQLNLGVKDVDGTLTCQLRSPEEVSADEFAEATQEHWLWWNRGDVDFQLKRGGTSFGSEIGGGMRPAVMVDYNPAVDDTTFARATKRGNLAVISARGTKITDAGLVHLTGLIKLQRLNIANTSVTDDGLRHLEALRSLKHIDVTGTMVTQTGVDRLQTALADVVIVTKNDNTSTKPSVKAATSNYPQPLPSTVTGIVIDIEDQPIANAQVTVLIRTFKQEIHEELKGPLVWTATTNDEGRYSFAPTGTVTANNEVRINVVADGYADLSGRDYEKKILSGVMPNVCVLAGRQIKGRLVDVAGTPVRTAIVRFQSCAPNLSIWDSGPLPVDSDGRFSVSIPSGGEAVGAIYPTDLAPRFVEVTNEADQGDIVLEKGVAWNGRVEDRNGEGVAKTIVGIRKTERRIMHAFRAILGTAVKTDESGYFQLPALSGEYELSVGRSVADCSRQMMLDGEAPPPIEPVTIKFDRAKPSEEIFLREQTSETSRFTK